MIEQSNVLGGASIEICLPILPCDVRHKPPKASPTVSSPVSGNTGLVVDDDPLVADVVAGMLESLGYTTHVSNSPVEALERLNSYGDIDFILSDFQMAGMSGAGLLSRAREQGHQQPFVFMTGYGGPMGEAMAEREFDWLEKPISRLRLAEVIQNALEASEDRNSDPEGVSES